MWMKLLGTALVWIGCIGIGNYLVENIKRRTGSLADIRKKLLLLRGDVGYASATLPEAVERIARLSGEQEGFFSLLASSLSEEDGVTFPEKWRLAVEGAGGSLALAREDAEELIRLGEYLGQKDKETQIRQLDWYLKQSEEALAEIRKGEKEKIHLYRMLSVLGGAFLCIILI